MTAAALQLLAGSPLFAGLSQPSLERLAGAASERSYRRYQVIFRQGDPGEELLAVAEGGVKLEVRAPTGEALLLTTLQPPDTFGELALLGGGSRSTTATALQDTRVLCLPKNALAALLEEDPSFAGALLDSLGGVISRLTGQVADLATLDLTGRVAKVLVTLAERQAAPHRPPERQLELERRLTQTELAHMTGGSRQSVNQVLGSFSARGLIEVRPAGLVILRLDLLRRRALG